MLLSALLFLRLLVFLWFEQPLQFPSYSRFLEKLEVDTETCGSNLVEHFAKATFGSSHHHDDGQKFSIYSLTLSRPLAALTCCLPDVGSAAG